MREIKLKSDPFIFDNWLSYFSPVTVFMKKHVLRSIEYFYFQNKVDDINEVFSEDANKLMWVLVLVKSGGARLLTAPKEKTRVKCATHNLKRPPIECFAGM